MRKLATTFFALVLMAGCSGGGSPSFQTDRTALLFGQGTDVNGTFDVTATNATPDGGK